MPKLQRHVEERPINRNRPEIARTALDAVRPMPGAESTIETVTDPRASLEQIAESFQVRNLPALTKRARTSITPENLAKKAAFQETVDGIFVSPHTQEKCECYHLRGFVGCCNSSRGAAYSQERCLDVEGRNDKEPELLLDAPNEIPIVVERKSVVWPRDEYFSDHRTEHDLYDLFLEIVRSNGNAFTDSAYQLTVNAKSLKGKKKGMFSE